MASWEWLFVQTSLANNDKQSGAVYTNVPIPAGRSCQRVILDGGASGMYINQHAAPGAERVPSPYTWSSRIVTRASDSEPVEYRMFRSTSPDAWQFAYNTGTIATTVMTWSVDPAWWQWDARVRFRATGSGAYVEHQFSWSNGHPTESGIGFPDNAWSGTIALWVLVSF